MASTTTRSIITRTSIIGGLLVGLVHAGIAVYLWNLWFDNLWEMLAIKPSNWVYIILGMFLLGFVPAVFYTAQKIISPAIIVAVLLTISVLFSGLAGPVGAPVSVPTPFGLYILFWVAIVALAGVIGVFEHRHKQRAID